MTRFFKILILGILITACNRQDPKEQIKYIDGYWEIKRVEIPPDSVVEYEFNETLDYLDLKGTTGFRKKVRPQLDGSFLVTENSEEIEARFEDGELFIYYTTPYDTWKDRVIHAEEDQIKLENERGYIYHYQRYSPITTDSYETEQ